MKVIKVIVGLALSCGTAWAADWPNWGRDGSRNMVSQERGLIESAEPGKAKPGEDVRYVGELSRKILRKNRNGIPPLVDSVIVTNELWQPMHFCEIMASNAGASIPNQQREVILPN